jgi:formylglycine-generating enzyme required for sulfatase activity
MRFFIAFAALLFFSCTAANAEAAKKKTPAPAEPPMQVRIVKSTQPGCEPNCPEWIAAQGKIDQETLARFKVALRHAGKKKLPVLIQSGGGSVKEAFAIGRLLRARGLDVAVAKTEFKACEKTDNACRKREKEGYWQGSPQEPAVCGSSCVFILAAGTRRSVSPWTAAGVHEIKSFKVYMKVLRRYTLTPRPDGGVTKTLISQEKLSQKTVESKTEESSYDEIRTYFASMGIGDQIMPLLRSAPNDSIHWLTRKELTETRIATDSASGLQVVQGTAPRTFSPAVSNALPSISPAPKPDAAQKQAGTDGAKPAAPWYSSLPARPGQDASQQTSNPAAQKLPGTDVRTDGASVPAPRQGAAGIAVDTGTSNPGVPPIRYGTGAKLKPDQKPANAASENKEQQTVKALPPPSISAEPHRSVRESFQDCADCPVMLAVPAGRFLMGARYARFQSDQSEVPQHEVTFSQPFAASETAVTFDQWDACVADRGCAGYRPSDNGWGRGDRPVINVSWYDVKAYTAWLSEKTGKQYRLLTEAEFEYMARAGTDTPYWWGHSVTPEKANFNDATAHAGAMTPEAYRQKTMPVRSFSPNPWGFYEVHGNVDVWVEDCAISNYKGAPADGSAATSGDCGKRVVRGGSWASFPSYLRSSYRVWVAPGSRQAYRGFRVARTL